LRCLVMDSIASTDYILCGTILHSILSNNAYEKGVH